MIGAAIPYNKKKKDDERAAAEKALRRFAILLNTSRKLNMKGLWLSADIADAIEMLAQAGYHRIYGDKA